MSAPASACVCHRQAATAACLAVLSLSACAHTAPSRPQPVGSARPTSDLALAEIGTGLPRSGQWRNGFDVADINGDGKLDLLFPPPRKGLGGPVIFRGDGNGGFERTPPLDLPALPFGYGDAVAADLDGDGRTDLALAIHLRGLAALTSSGGWAFSDSSQGLPLAAAGSGFSSRALEAADWDGDGRVDLVAFAEGPVLAGGNVRGGSGGLRVFLNRGDHWQPVTPPGPDPAFGDSLAVADIDGDGRVDAVTSAGGATGRRLLHINDGSSWRNEELEDLRAQASVGSVAVADLDGDGATDLLVGYLDSEGGTWHSGVDLFHAATSGFERHELLREEGRNQIRALACGDLDEDGSPEVVALREDGSLNVITYGNQERRIVVSAPDWRQGCSGSGLRLADLDGNGSLEIVASFSGEASAFDLDGGCRSGGGIQAWAVTADTE